VPKTLKKDPVDSFAYSTAVSQDGTKIGFLSTGRGPGLIIIPGALTTSVEFTAFASYLSDLLTVHILDRRGRGESGSQGPDYSICKECEDIAAVQEATGASYLFGLSYGGLVALEAAMANQSPFEKIALYEPGIYLHSVPTDWEWLSEYEEDLDKQDYRGAFTTFVQGASQTFLSRVPKWFAKLNLCIGIRGEHWERISRLLKENLTEHKEVQRLASTYRKYKTIQSDVLLMAGHKSPESTHQTIRELNRTIKCSQMLIIPRLHHLSPENGYSPLQVAQHVKTFLTN